MPDIKVGVQFDLDEANPAVLEERLKALKKAEDEAAEGARDLAGGGREAASGASDAAGGVNKMASELRQLKNINAKQLMLDINRAMADGARVISNVAKNLGNMTAESAKAWHEMKILADTVGLAWDEVDSLGDVADLAGVGLSGLQKLMTRLATDTVDATGGLTATGKVVQSLGVNLLDANGNLRETGPLLKDTLDQILKLDSDTQKINIFGQIFGKRDVSFIRQAISQGAKDFQGLVGAGSPILNDADIRVLDKYNEQLFRLNDTLADIKSKGSADFARMFGPSLEKLESGLSSLAQKYPFLGGVINFSKAAGGSLPELLQAVADLTVTVKLLGGSEGATNLLGGGAAGAAGGAAAAAAARRIAAEIEFAKATAKVKTLAGAVPPAQLGAMLNQRAAANAELAASEVALGAATKVSRFTKVLKLFGAAIPAIAVAAGAFFLGKQLSGGGAAEAQNVENEGRARDQVAQALATSGGNVTVTSDGKAHIIATIEEYDKIIKEELDKRRGGWAKRLWSWLSGRDPGLEDWDFGVKGNGATSENSPRFQGMAKQAADLSLELSEVNKELEKFDKKIKELTPDQLNMDLGDVSASALDKAVRDNPAIQAALGGDPAALAKAKEDLAVAKEKLSVLQAQGEEARKSNAAIDAEIAAAEAKIERIKRGDKLESRGLVMTISEKERLIAPVQERLDILKSMERAVAPSGLDTAGADVASLEQLVQSLKDRNTLEDEAIAKLKDQLKVYRDQVSFLEGQKAAGVQISNAEIQAARDRVSQTEEELELIKKKREEMEKMLKLRILEIQMSKNAQIIEEAKLIDNMSPAGIKMIAGSSPSGKLFSAQARQIEMEYQKDLLEGTIPKEEAVRKRHIAMFELKLTAFKDNVEKLRKLSEATLRNIDAQMSLAVEVGDEALVQKLQKQREIIQQELIARQADIASLGDPVELKTLNTMKLAEALRKLEEALGNIRNHFERIASINQSLATKADATAGLFKAAEQLDAARHGDQDYRNPVRTQNILEEERKSREARLKAARAEEESIQKQVAERRKANNGVLTPQMSADLANAKRARETAESNIQAEELLSRADLATKAFETRSKSVGNYLESLKALVDYYSTVKDIEEEFNTRRKLALAEYRAALMDGNKANDLIAAQVYQNSLLSLRIEKKAALKADKEAQQEDEISKMQKELRLAQSYYNISELTKESMEVRLSRFDDVIERMKALEELYKNQGKLAEALVIQEQRIRMEKEKQSKLSFGQELLLASGGAKQGIQDFLDKRFSTGVLESLTPSPWVSPKDLENLKKGLGKELADTLGQVFAGDIEGIPSGQVSKIREALQANILGLLERVLG